MMLRVVKATIHAALLLQVLQSTTSVNGREVSNHNPENGERKQVEVSTSEFFANEERGVSTDYDDEDEEERMSEKDFVFTTPIPGSPPPPSYEEMLEVVKPMLAKFNATVPESKKATTTKPDSNESDSEKEDTPSPPQEKKGVSKKKAKDEEDDGAEDEDVKEKDKADTNDEDESDKKKKVTAKKKREVEEESEADDDTDKKGATSKTKKKTKVDESEEDEESETDDATDKKKSKSKKKVDVDETDEESEVGDKKGSSSKTKKKAEVDESEEDESETDDATDKKKSKTKKKVDVDEADEDSEADEKKGASSKTKKKAKADESEEEEDSETDVVKDEKKSKAKKKTEVEEAVEDESETDDATDKKKSKTKKKAEVDESEEEDSDSDNKKGATSKTKKKAKTDESEEEEDSETDIVKDEKKSKTKKKAEADVADEELDAEDDKKKASSKARKLKAKDGDEANEEDEDAETSTSKSKTKKNKEEERENEDDEDAPVPKKKKKNSEEDDAVEDDAADDDTVEEPAPKKKKKKTTEEDDAVDDDAAEDDEDVKPVTKKKKKTTEEDDADANDDEEPVPKKKTKKTTEADEADDDDAESVPKKKKKTTEEDDADDDDTAVVPKKKKKTTDEDDADDDDTAVVPKKKKKSTEEDDADDDDTAVVPKKKKKTTDEDEADDDDTAVVPKKKKKKTDDADEDEELNKLLASMDSSGGGDDEFSDLAGSGDNLFSSLLDGGANSGSGSLDMDSVMKEIGAMFGEGGMSGLFGGDPTQPLNLTVEDDDILLGELYGGIDEGDAFSDIKNIKFGQMLLNITVRGSARVDSVGLQMMTQETYVNLIHGGKGGGEAHLAPEMGETIKKVELHWDEHKGKTCIFYIKITITSGKYIAAGKKTSNVATIKAPKGYQIGGFYGRADKHGIYCMGAIFTRAGVQDLTVTDVMALPDKVTPDVYQYNTTIRNWVGPLVVASDTACYKKSVGFSSKRKCPSGYHPNGKDCAAQCPLQYPVECFSQCIPQNGDCAMEIIAKVSAAAAVALNFATAGVFGALFAAYRGASHALNCAINIVNAVKSIVYYTRYVQTTIPQTETEKLMDQAFKLQVVILDIPLAVCACLGIKIPNKLQFSAIALAVTSALVMMAIMIGEAIFGSKDNVLLMLREAGAMNTTALDSKSIDLETILNTKNGTCGYQMRTLTNRVLGKVYEARNNYTKQETNDLRVKVSKSEIVRVDIPTVTNHCMGDLWKNKTSATAFEIRALLRKTLGVIVDQIVEKGMTDMGRNVVKQEKAIEYANMGLFILSMFDPTGIAWMASEFVQPVCGPSDYLGEIDDGTLYDALGLTTVDQAFLGSYGIWKRVGDGTVKIHFESIDIYNVDVVIHSGGDKIAEVHVPAGGNVTWASTVKELQDKTLYLDRWRPNVIGLKGSGGGSLLVWVPRSSDGGQLILHARINVS